MADSDRQIFRLRRGRAFRRAARQRRLDLYLVTRPEDVGYLTGFTGDDSHVVFDRSWACLVTDGRYAEQAAAECPDIDIHVRAGDMSAAIADALKGRRKRRLGVQADHLTLKAAKAIAKALKGTELIPLADVTGALRTIKDDSELRSIRTAVSVAERAFRELIAGGAKALVGRTERDVAAELDYRMRRLGASGPAFETVVAAGANSSKPHYRPGGVRICRNEAVLLDWGAVVDGYCSDLTRVVFAGRMPPKLIEAYEVVARAQAGGIAAIRPGVACKTVDAAARRVIEAAGLGQQFLHGLGHGIGRVIHEAPALGPRGEARLRKGMVLTVEPGVYLPGVGGIRIEDDVLVTSTGARRLSSLPGDLKAMALG